ncbi:radical SAM protein [Vibrio aestuarianus subsp. cardii]|uniref:radical SAM protein n=1 Tax=Vibrio aestuarianus TaxID=28171 RepID=UPI0015933509|nr:radical SAM protein [Vibrio aestuarianus]MDE1310369.1 radical SAM protein [Vibrio aestuarianus]NGZ94354.1 radical SAM protein [Vibrio aestuarianus subsp. cardii]
MINSATVVLKITERCNINCKYCYFFNKDNQEYVNHSPIIKSETVSDVIDFLDQAISDLGICKMTISFHGGEPLMMGKKRFTSMMEKFQEKNGYTSMMFCIQTNGTLIDEEWANIFNKYRINVGVSLDGPEHIHNLNRIDKSNKGTYESVINGIKLLKKMIGAEHISIMSVANVNYPANDIFNHVINDLGINTFDVLIEDYNHDTTSTKDVKLQSKYLSDVLNCWINCDTKPRISFIKRMMDRLTAESKDELILGHGSSIVITIDSNGNVCPTDEIMNCRIDLFRNSKYVKETTLAEYLDQDVIYNHVCHRVDQDCYECNVRFDCRNYAMNTIPDGCQSCELKYICQGDAIGNIGNRYSKDNGFNNPSVHCEIIKDVYSRGVALLINSGYERSKIENLMTIDNNIDYIKICE